MGDCNNSWGIDLKKQTKWHLNQDGSVRLPYAKGLKVTQGGIIQCYLDLEKNKIAFGYNGEYLGVAFDSFEVGNGMFAAVSTNLENECKLNFGATPFRYSQTEFLPLKDCINYNTNTQNTSEQLSSSYE